jgi:hypothetical protein
MKHENFLMDYFQVMQVIKILFSILITIIYKHQDMFLNENINMVIAIVLKLMHVYQKQKMHMKKVEKTLRI